MKWTRVQAPPTSTLDTHRSQWMEDAWEVVLQKTKHFTKAYELGRINQTWSLDPFARSCPWADLRNDLNPEMPTQYHLDAIDFLEEMIWRHGPSSMYAVILDPPFSERQAKKYLKGEMKHHPNLYAKPGYMHKVGLLVHDLLAPHGLVLKLGFNSNAPSKGLELIQGSTIAFGGNRNDVQLTIWRKPED